MSLYLDPKTGEWVTLAELHRRQEPKPHAVDIPPAWLRQREEEEKPQEVQVLGSEPLRRPALPAPEDLREKFKAGEHVTFEPGTPMEGPAWEVVSVSETKIELRRPRTRPIGES